MRTGYYFNRLRSVPTWKISQSSTVRAVRVLPETSSAAWPFCGWLANSLFQDKPGRSLAWSCASFAVGIVLRHAAECSYDFSGNSTKQPSSSSVTTQARSPDKLNHGPCILDPGLLTLSTVEAPAAPDGEEPPGSQACFRMHPSWLNAAFLPRLVFSFWG